MEKGKKEAYQVVITRTAEIAFYEITEYLYEHMSLDRAEEVSSALMEFALNLNKLYYRGTLERMLAQRKKTYRYILFKRTPRAHVKVIYYVDDLSGTVFVTDFFPTEKDPKKMRKRNK